MNWTTIRMMLAMSNRRRTQTLEELRELAAGIEPNADREFDRNQYYEREMARLRQNLEAQQAEIARAAIAIVSPTPEPVVPEPRAQPRGPKVHFKTRQGWRLTETQAVGWVPEGGHLLRPFRGAPVVRDSPEGYYPISDHYVSLRFILAKSVQTYEHQTGVTKIEYWYEED